MKATSVYFFPNGCIACCDENGQQIGELQAPYFQLWLSHMQLLGYNPDDLREIHLPSGRAKLIKYQDDDGKTRYNWEMK